MAGNFAASGIGGRSNGPTPGCKTMDGLRFVKTVWVPCSSTGFNWLAYLLSLKGFDGDSMQEIRRRSKSFCHRLNSWGFNLMCYQQRHVL